MTDQDDLRTGWVLFQTPPDSHWDQDSRGQWAVATWHPSEYSSVSRGSVCLDGTAYEADIFQTLDEALACLRRRVEVE